MKRFFGLTAKNHQHGADIGYERYPRDFFRDYYNNVPTEIVKATWKYVKFPDIMFNDHVIPIFSIKVKKIVDSFLTDIDSPLWIDFEITNKNNELQRYYLIHFQAARNFFPTDADIDWRGDPKFVLNKIKDRHILRPYSPYRFGIFVSLELKEAIEVAKCTNTYFYEFEVVDL